MNYSILKVDVKSAKAILIGNKTPSIVYASSAIIKADDTPVPLIWSASLPVENKANKRNVKIELGAVDSILDESAICKLIKDHESFDHVLSSISVLHQENQESIKDFADSKSFSPIENTQNIFCNPDPAHHDSGSIYISQEYQNKAGKLVATSVWSLSLTKGKYALVKYNQLNSNVTYARGSKWLNVFSFHLPKPELAGFNHALVNCSMIINDIDHSIARRKNIESSVRIEYRQNGQLAALKNHTRINGGDLIVVWDGEFVPNIGWQIDFKGFEYRDGDVYEHLSVPMMEAENYELPHDVLVFSHTECVDELESNNTNTKEDIVEEIIGGLKNQTSINHDFRMFFTEYKGLYRCSRLNHSIHLEKSFINVIWEVVGDARDGFDMWPKAKFKLLHIKISGIKYTFFPDSKEYPGLMAQFPPDFLEVSQNQTLAYLLMNHEPFYRMVIGK